MSDPIDQLQRTVTITGNVIANVKPDQLDDATTCTEWTVRDLLNHMVGTALMFGAAAAGEKATINPFGQPDDVIGDDPRAAYDDAGARMVKAWRERGLDGGVTLVRGEMPAAGACTIAICDQLAHGWDLAQATGQPFDADDDLVDFAWDFTHANMGPEGRGEGKPFQQPVEIADSSPKLDRLMAFMGRRPLAR